MVDPPLAERRVCLLDRVPVCGSLFPRVRYLDSVCFCWLHTSSRAWCLRQQSPYWSKFWFCCRSAPFCSCQLCVSLLPIGKRDLCSHPRGKGKSEVAFTLRAFSPAWISIPEVRFEGLMMAPSGAFLLCWLERAKLRSKFVIICVLVWFLIKVGSFLALEHSKVAADLPQCSTTTKVQHSPEPKLPHSAGLYWFLLSHCRCFCAVLPELWAWCRRSWNKWDLAGLASWTCLTGCRGSTKTWWIHKHFLQREESAPETLNQPNKTGPAAAVVLTVTCPVSPRLVLAIPPK